MLLSMQEGRADREKPSRKPKRLNPNASTTNREKSKNKNFMMLKQKAKGKLKRSFKDKQVIFKRLARQNHVAVFINCSLFTDYLAQCPTETEEDGFEEISQ